MPESLFVEKLPLGDTTRCTVLYPERVPVPKATDGITKASVDLSPGATYIDIYMSIADQSLNTMVNQTKGKYVTLRRAFWNAIADNNGAMQRADLATFKYENVTFVSWLSDTGDSYGARFVTLSPETRDWVAQPAAGLAD